MILEGGNIYNHSGLSRNWLHQDMPAMFKCAARLYTMPLAIIIRKAVSLFW